MGDIILYLIGLFIWCFIGAAAAFERYKVFTCGVIVGFWYFLLLLIFNWGWTAALMTIVYLIVVIGDLIIMVERCNKDGL